MPSNNNLIQMAAEEQRQESILPEYQAETSDAECLGIAIAHWAEWTGDTIVEAFLSALEDANYHAQKTAFETIWRDSQ